MSLTPEDRAKNILEYANADWLDTEEMLIDQIRQAEEAAEKRGAEKEREECAKYIESRLDRTRYLHTRDWFVELIKAIWKRGEG